MLRIYNGVNHDVKFFDYDKILMNRNQQAFLADSMVQPKKTIKREKALSVAFKISPTENLDMPKTFLPEVMTSKISDFCPDFYNFDIIIVSNFYAKIASYPNNVNPDYLDRLYVPLPVYDMDPQTKNAKATKVGSYGLKKVWYPKTPREYVMDIRSGYIPSYESMRICLDIYKNQKVDYETGSYLHEIWKFIFDNSSFE